MGEHRIQRQIPPEGCTLALNLAPVSGSRNIIRQIDDVRRGIRRQGALCAAQLGSVVIAHAVQNGIPVCPGEDPVQELIPLRTVAAALPARTVHCLACIVQQPAEGDLQGKKLQDTISFAFQGF